MKKNNIKENSSATFRVNPNINPVEIVIPNLEIPGSTERH